MTSGFSSSMFKKIKGFIVRRKSSDISPTEAEKIQKASYALARAEVKKYFSPVYLSILSGLDSEEKQIFEATAYYLTKIAINKAKYKEEILEILKNKVSQKDINPEYKEYLKQKIRDILTKNNS